MCAAPGLGWMTGSVLVNNLRQPRLLGALCIQEPCQFGMFQCSFTLSCDFRLDCWASEAEEHALRDLWDLSPTSGECCIPSWHARQTEVTSMYLLEAARSLCCVGKVLCNARLER
jgi:hypothetical protein